MGITPVVSVSGQRICRLAEEAADAPDPEVALERLMELRHELAEFERQQVARALTAGRSFGTIAGAMGVSRQAVHRRFKDLSRRRRRSEVPPSPEVRLAVEYAGEEAKSHGAAALVAAHLVVGILRTGDRRGAAALASAGVDLEVCRAAVPAASPDDLGLRALLSEAVQAAKQRGGDRIEIEDVLRAALAGRHASVSGMLEAAGVSAGRILQELDAMPADQPDCLEA